MIYSKFSITHYTIYLILFILLLTPGCSSEMNKQRVRPNFILVVTDDQSQESIKYMKKLQLRIKEKGIHFSNTFVASPVCGPSRGAILTGMLPHNSGIKHGFGQLLGNNEKRTIVTDLKKAGYTNVLLGKYINGYGVKKPKHIPPGWDQWHAIVDENRFYDYRLNENGSLVHYGKNDTDYITDVLSNKATDFLQSHDRTQPFFMYISHVAPHVPHIPSEQYTDTIVDTVPPLTFEKDISDKPAWVRNYAKLNPYLVGGYWNNREMMEKYFQNRWRTLLSVDDMLENLFINLEKSGLMSNTYVLFISDNGDGLSKHIPVSPKLTPYDEGIKVPFYMVGPDVPSNMTLDHLVSSVDIFPTLTALAGVKPHKYIDGKSLVPLIEEPNTPDSQWQDSIISEIGNFQDIWPWKSCTPPFQLLRTKNFKYVQYFNGEREYYDLQKDPDEMTNIYKQLSSERKEELAQTLQERGKNPSQRS